MSFKIVLNNRHRQPTGLVGRLADGAQRRPGVAAGILLASGLVLGLGASVGIAGARTAHLSATVEKQQAELAASRATSQREINALAARLGELQAQANRLNALGERLTRAGQLRRRRVRFRTAGPDRWSGPRARHAPRRAASRADLAREGIRRFGPAALRDGSAAVQPRARSQRRAFARSDRQQLHHLRLRRSRRSHRRRPPVPQGHRLQGEGGRSRARRRRRRGQLLRRALGLRQRRSKSTTATATSPVTRTTRA